MYTLHCPNNPEYNGGRIMDPAPYGNDALYAHQRSRRPMGDVNERGNTYPGPSFSHHLSPLDRRVVLLVGWLRRVTNIVGPSRIVACAPRAFRRGGTRVDLRQRQ